MMRFFVVLGLAFFLFGCSTEDQPEEIPSLPVEKKDEPANKENTKTVYVLLSENETIVEDVLKFAGEKERVLVYGKEEWLKRIKFVSSIENIAPFRYAVGTFLDYHNESIKDVHRMYRMKFNSDMSKMSGIGYDATLNMVMYLLYNKELDNGVVHNFKFDFEGSPSNHNIGGYILNFENLNRQSIVVK